MAPVVCGMRQGDMARAHVPDPRRGREYTPGGCAPIPRVPGVLPGDAMPERTGRPSNRHLPRYRNVGLHGELAARKPESPYDCTPLLQLTATLGLRIGEVLGLRWEDFDRADGEKPEMARVLASGRVAQRESTRFTREGSLVRSQPRPSERACKAASFGKFALAQCRT